MPINQFAIPAELRALNQWVVWKYEDVGPKPTKVPYCPSTGELASVNNLKTWSSFLEAFNKFNLGTYDGIGFVFTDNDPYTFIDLDDARYLKGNEPNPNYNSDHARQIKIYHEFNSYSEISPSGNGLHIIVKGKVAAGRRRSFIEVYSAQRYATFTGNVYNNVPIVDAQEKLSQLWEQMGGNPVTQNFQGDDVEKLSDSEVISRALNAANGDKFKRLHEGQWQGDYQSQSEADFAYVDIIAFYTQNRNQITRLFQTSALGQRDKAKRHDYVNYMLNRAFDRMLPPIDFDGFKNQLELQLEENKKTNVPTKVEAPKHTALVPPGLLGEIAQFIYAASPRPVPETALAAAIGLMAGICGRAWNISGTGLNQYILLIADTGTGKEAMASGIDKLMNTIKLQVPTSSEFIGPSEIASGQALIKYLSNTSSCFVSVLGEFGLRLQSMSHQNASSAEITLRRILLDLFNKSGFGQSAKPSIYADKEKNTNIIYSPSFSLLGETVPEKFYGNITEDMISEGLLPRFMFIEYKGPRPKLNQNHINAVPSLPLVEKLAGLAAYASRIMYEKRVVNVVMNEAAQKMADDFNDYADDQINNSNKDLLKQLWNRAHIKTLKLSALLAVGVNMSDPIITPEHVKWSMDMVKFDIEALSSRFERGEIGGNSFELSQSREVIRVIRDYVTGDWPSVCKYTTSMPLFNDKIIPYSYIQKRLFAAAAFRNDRLGATVAIKRTVQNLLDADRLREVGKQDMTIKYGTTQRAFVISNPKLLDD